MEDKMTSETLHAENPNQLMKEREAASFLCISQRTLQKWRVTGFGPEYIHISSRAVRYRYGDVNDWMMDRRVRSTSQYNQ